MVAVVVVSAICSTPVNAGRLNTILSAEDNFIDWEYSQKVWTEAKTFEKFKKEDAKYSAIADPWLKSLNYSRTRIKEALKNAPDNKETLAKKRGHDIQLLWDFWYDEVYGGYMGWFNSYKRGSTNKTFDEYLEKRKSNKFESIVGTVEIYKKPSDCFKYRSGFYNRCPIPDWRTTDMLTKEKAMMKKAKGLYKQKNKARKAQEAMIRNLMNIK
ncbi:MAG: hypothetical protein KAJ75_02040 [Alphaproteobacteria bacterium]|nr:hypothetical protein [Alphaproteobacteria bacterium]